MFRNAVKYAQTKVFIGLQATVNNDTHFAITIKNDGFIIPKDMADKIFEPFFRLKESE